MTTTFRPRATTTPDAATTPTFEATTVAGPLRTATERATHWTWGVALSAGLAAFALVDQLWLRLTAAAVEAHYRPLGANPDPNQLTTGLAVFWALAAVSWWASGRLARRGARTVPMLTHMIGSLAVATGFAVAATLGYEFGGFVLPGVWRALVWPVVALGLYAVIATARARRAGR